MIDARVKRPARGILAGVVAGIVGIGCCVGPAVAALTGVASAAFALDLATTLYADWGWAFKLAGAASATAAILLARRSAITCRTSRVGVWRYGAVVIVTGVATYGLLYGATTWLGSIAS